MDIFDKIRESHHEQVIFCHDPDAGLDAIIAIHDTTLGPALGGTRMWPYRTTEEAVVDALRLSEGMTYKAAVANLALGGGKAVIIGDPRTEKTEALLRAHGRFVNTLNGRYITAEDVGISVRDMEYVYRETEWVTGIQSKPHGSGDPSPVTAYGVYHGIRASCKWKLGTDDLEGVRIAIQGAGQVGYYLCEDLVDQGALLTVTDIDESKVRRAVSDFGATAVASDAIYDVECEVFAPCALGAILNDETIPRLRCSIIAGAANNQLADDRHGDILEQKGVLYAPDYVINAGGLINVYGEIAGYGLRKAKQKAEEIYDTLLSIYRIAEDEVIPTYRAADRLAQQRLEAVRRERRATIPSVASVPTAS